MRISFPIFLFLFLFFIGCKGANNPQFANKKHDSIKNNPMYIYGEGEAPNFALAKQYAIRDLAANLQVSISYTTKETTKEHNNSLKTQSVSNIFVESRIKDVPSVEVEKTTKSKNGVHVRVRVEQKLLEGAILNRINLATQELESMLELCATPAFKESARAKKILKELQNDIALYQALSKNMAYGTALLLEMQDMVSQLPSYALIWDTSSLGNYEKEVQTIVKAELAKFIKIDSNASRTVRIKADTENNLRFFIEFSDCKHNLENTIQIDTYASLYEIMQSTKRARLGAMIYKVLATKNLHNP